MGLALGRIDAGACLWAALLLLTLPLSWLCAAFLAAVFHEVCHAAAIKLLGGSIHNLRIGAGSTKLETVIPGKGRELLCALAGPLGSFLLVLLCHRFPKIAICGLVQGLFNILPLYPMDGGRILHCAVALLFPGREETVCTVIRRIILGILVAAALVWGGFLSVAVLFLILKGPMRKIPCKPRRIGVQ